MDDSPLGWRAERANQSKLKCTNVSSVSQPYKITLTVPGGNGAEGSRDIDEARKGELSGESESIEAVRTFRVSPITRKIAQTVPGGNRTHI